VATITVSVPALRASSLPKASSIAASCAAA